MAPGRLTVIVLWLAAAMASQRRKNKKKADAAAAGRPPSMTLDARPLKYKDDAVGSYAKTWAAPNTNRSEVAHFLKRFPAIDVGCTYDVESSGEGAVLPRLVFNFADGSSSRAEPGWTDHFKTRPYDEEARTKLLFEGNEGEDYDAQRKALETRRVNGERLIGLK